MKRILTTAALAICVIFSTAAAYAQSDRETRHVGRINDHTGVTANDWDLTPVGTIIPIGECPQGALLSPDGRWLAVSNDGHGVESLQFIDTKTRRVVHHIDYRRPEALFQGLAFSADGTSLFASGGPRDVVRVISIGADAVKDGAPISLRVKPAEPVDYNPEMYAGKAVLPDISAKNTVLYPIGLALDPRGKKLWTTESLGNAVDVLDPATRTVLTRIPVGLNPYGIRFSPFGTRAYVTLWGARKVAVIDALTNRVTQQIEVGNHPCGMALDAKAGRLYVANAHSDTVSIIDTTTNRVVGEISLKPYPNAPLGSIPNAIAVSPHGDTLYIANAGNNDLAVVRMDEQRLNGTVSGLIPTGWYPTAVQVSADGNTIWAASMKGVGTTQNGDPQQYVGELLNGICQAIPRPTAEDLAKYTAMVSTNDLLDNAGNVRVPANITTSPIPRRVGDPSPIKYCVYVIKENRTYDQVFGDMKQGNGDPNLVFFGRDVTPNHHAIAEKYVLLDNFYVDGSVSVDGHPWAKSANVPDAIEKGWPISYSQRGPLFGGPLGTPSAGWIWQQAEAAGVSNNVYNSGIEPGRDLKSVAQILSDVKHWEQTGDMPHLIVAHLPNDHTFGTAPGKPTPRAMVAENDLAVGRLVEGLSKSKFWPQMVVMMVEDDAQAGYDHVDCHRTVGLIAGPYVKRGVVDSNFYDQVAMLRTIELILGLQPLSQFDAAAMPMFTCFTNTPDDEPYTALTPQQPLNEMNTKTAYGANECLAMNFSEVDEAPFADLNRILWHSIKGVNVPEPPIINNRFALGVRLHEDD